MAFERRKMSHDRLRGLLTAACVFALMLCSYLDELLVLPRWDETICVVVTVCVRCGCAFWRWVGKVCNLWKQIHHCTAIFQTCVLSLTSTLLLVCPRVLSAAV